MDILIYYLWISLISTLVNTYEYNNYDFFDYYNPETRLLSVRNHHRPHKAYDVRIMERSAERSQSQQTSSERKGQRNDGRSFQGPTERRERPGERRSSQMNERPANERSIAVNSGVQRVQEQEKLKRTQPRDESIPRYENGSYKVVNRYPSHSSVLNRRGVSGKEPPSADSVVFPGPTSQSSLDFVPEIPLECEELGICETIPNYPHELVDTVIAQLGQKKDRVHHIDVLEPELTQRFGRPEENIELCNYKEKVVMPQAAKNKDGEWYVILNQKDKPLQGYRVEICKMNGSSCDGGIATFQKGYNATCRQKYVQRTMAALDVNTKEVHYDMPFRVPSCCSCVASHIAK